MLTTRQIIMTMAVAGLATMGSQAADPKPNAAPAFKCPFMSDQPASEAIKECPLMETSVRTPTMEERGDKAMGFSHAKTTHHFRLFPDGGAIEVEANDLNDDKSRAAIRKHLSDITSMFAAGNFKVPFEVHAQVPPGAGTMEELKTKIQYRYEDMEKGGRVRLITSDVEALKAIHAFVRFQIEEHGTGDSIEVQSPPDPPKK